MKRPTDLTGQRFGRLVVKEYAGKNNLQRTQWRCQCDCGNETVVVAGSLMRGLTQSCGCYHREVVHAMGVTHGDSATRLYKTWLSMKYRCCTPTCKDYDMYGGRGITVCEEWMQYERFRDWALSNGYDDSQTIDRIDVDGDYEPSNCRWVDMNYQANNKRSNYVIEYDGRTMTATQWSREVGISADVIKYRIRHNWTTEEALTIPPGGKRNA